LKEKAKVEKKKADKKRRKHQKVNEDEKGKLPSQLKNLTPRSVRTRKDDQVRCEDDSGSSALILSSHKD